MLKLNYYLVGFRMQLKEWEKEIFQTFELSDSGENSKNLQEENQKNVEI